jgi:hypothetical protein
MMHGQLFEEFPTTYEDIKFIKAAVLLETQDFEITVIIQRGLKH